MDSPFAKDPKHEDASPARHIILLMLLVAIVGAVAAAAMGYVHVRIGKEPGPAPAEEEKAGGLPLPGKGGKPATPSRALLQEDVQAEKTLGFFLPNAHVYRAKGAKVHFRLESEMDGKKQTLAETGVKLENDGSPTTDSESVAAWVFKDDTIDVRMSADATANSRSGIAFPRLKPSSPMNQIVRGTDRIGVPADLKAFVGKDVELYKLEEVEHFMKDDGTGVVSTEKTVPRRTLRLIARIVAVNLRDETK